MKTLAILGASGHGKVLADAALLCGWENVVFFDDAWPSIKNNSIWSIEGDSINLSSRIDEFSGVIVAIGNNSIRLEKSLELEAKGANLVSLYHPTSIISSTSTIGLGSFVGAGAVVNIDSSIGKCSILNTNSVVEHDCRLGDAVHISPNAAIAGAVTVGNESWVGIGVCVKQLVHIGKNVIVGAGSVVINDVEDGVTIAGSPARALIKN